MLCTINSSTSTFYAKSVWDGFARALDVHDIVNYYRLIGRGHRIRGSYRLAYLQTKGKIRQRISIVQSIISSETLIEGFQNHVNRKRSIQ